MKLFFLYIMIALYILAGINHFWHPKTYMQIMPPWVPFHQQMVFISGVCEIVFALLLVFPQTRMLGAWCMILLLIAIFPANIQMLLDFYHASNPKLWIAILRLPIQFLL